MGKEKLDKITSRLFIARARVGVGLLFGFFALLCFSHPASAASYLNVSSGLGGAISFGRVDPVASGTSATTSDTLTINTNCTVGYSVYVSAQNGKGTSLVNTESDVTTNNTIPTSSAAIGSAASLANNTWGISPVDDGTYFGLPAYASATSTAFTTKSDVGESSTVPVYYGMKATTALVPGTYTGDILYTVLPDSACLVYTIHFDANGGTGTMNNQVINVGSATALSANTFTRSGYTFLGWSESANGKTGTAVNGVGTAADVDYEDKQSVTDIASFNTTKNLYAIWAPVTGNMQDFSCSSIASGATAYLRDSRDNQVYRVYRIPTDQTYKDSSTIANIAGKCIMTEDLSLGMVVGGDISSTGSNLTLSPGKSNFDANASSSSYETASYGATETINYVNAANGGTGWNETNSYTNKQYTYGPRSGYGDYSNHAYYSWGAALVACPKGWRLPTNESASAEYSDNSQVATPANGIAAIVGNSVDGRTAIQSAPWNFIAGGSFYSSGWRSQGSDGNYWTSTQSSNTNIYYLSFNATNVYKGNGGKSYGRSVRCIAQNDYTVSYSANGGSGSASKTSETAFESDAITMPTKGTLTKTDYDFKGWALTSNATTATYTANQSVSVSDLLTAASAAGQTTTSGSTITLYAVWEQAIDGYMQSWTSCSSLSVGQSVRLQDTRDNKVYTVKKLPDGKCWMIENLTLGSEGGLALTPADTNIDNNTTYYLPPAGKQGSITSSSTTTSTTNVNFSQSSDNQARVAYKAAGTTDNDESNPVPEDTGYYNFYAATLGYSYYSDGKTSGSSTRDICPKGWRLPWTSDAGATKTTTADFYALADLYNPSATWTNKPTSSSTGNPYTTDTTIFINMISGDASSLDRFGNNGAAGFTYAGNYYDTTLLNVGINSSYWSSSVISSTSGYSLYVFTNKVFPEDGSSKNLGLAVRCVAYDTMQDFNASSFSTTVGTATRLMDARDGKIYTVKRLKDGKVWMMQNLTIGMDGAKTLTPADTNIDDDKTYYLPPAGKQGSSTIDNSSTLAATDTANFVNSSPYADQHAKTQFRTKDTSITNDSDTGYYNFYTATLGFSYYQDGKTSGSSTRDICPKGWRLPKTPNTTTEQVSSIGSDNDFTYLVRQYSTSNWSGSSTGSGSTSYYTTNSTAKNSMYLSAASPLATTTQNNYAGFSYAGYWDGTNTSARYVGSYGRYWSSSVYNTNSGYRLSFDSSSIYPQNYGGKYYGIAVRCVAKS